MGELSGKIMELWVETFKFELCLSNVNQFYGTECLKSWQFLSQSRNLPPLIETKFSLPYSQVTPTLPYPGRNKYSCWISVKSISKLFFGTLLGLPEIPSVLVSRTKFCTYFYIPCVLKDLPIFVPKFQDVTDIWEECKLWIFSLRSFAVSVSFLLACLNKRDF